MNKKLPLVLLAAALLALPACSSDGAPPVYEPREPYTPPAQNTPSPWVQGQIDWANCLDSGKSEEQCRAELN